jgi:hypothetical protein
MASDEGRRMTLAHESLTTKEARSLLGGLGASLSMVVAVSLVFAALFLPVAQSSGATTTGYTIRRHEQELKDLNADIYNAQAQLAQLGSLTRVRAEAGRLGMVMPGGPSVSVQVTVPAQTDVRLPRRYDPVTAATRPTEANAHGGPLWAVLHAVHLR